MTDKDFSRILDAVDGFWPHAPLKPNARKAWRHLLGKSHIDAALDAISDYAAEGHPFPPVAGQIAARAKPPQAKTADETELERATRQKRTATQLVKDGKMTQADWNFYEQTYWSLHITPEQEKAA